MAIAAGADITEADSRCAGGTLSNKYNKIICIQPFLKHILYMYAYA